MGQKVHPVGFRLGINKPWLSRWYADRDYQRLAIEDARIRQFIVKRFPRTLGREGGRRRGGAREAAISRVEIERAANAITLTLHTAKPGIIIGRGGRGVEELKDEIERLTSGRVTINVVEVRDPEMDAQLVADQVASQVERRVAFRRAVSQAVQRTMRAGAQGVRITVAGRLGGMEMSRSYTGQEGKVPRQTLRADLDYGFTEAKTTYGNIGVKVWVYRGDILPEAVTPPTPKVTISEEGEVPEGVRWRVAPQQAERARELEAQAAKAAEADEAAAAAPDTEGAPPVAESPGQRAPGPAGTPDTADPEEHVDDVDAEATEAP